MSRGWAGVGLAVLIAAGSPAPSDAARGSRRLECPGGRYLVSSGSLIGGTGARDVVVISSDRVSVRGRCAPVPMRVRKTQAGWVVRAVWRKCDGLRGRARLRAKLDDPCDGLEGRFVARRARLRRSFTARLSSCPDGKIEADDGEDCTSAGDSIVGLRFPGVPVPPGAIVLRAYVQFRAAAPSPRAASVEVAGQAGDAAPFSTAPHDVSGRARTAASVRWSPPAWNAAGDAGPDQQTPDLAPVVQEIVDRPGWSAAGSIGLLITGNGSRAVGAWDGDPAGAPVLLVEYDTDTSVRPSAPATRTAAGTTIRTSARAAGVSAGPVPSTTSVTTTDASPLAVAPPVVVLEVRVRASADDAEERPSGSVDRTSTDLELVEDGDRSQVVGMRFTDVDIPPGAIVRSAYVQFQVDEKSTDATAITVAGEAVDSAAAFGSAARDVSRRARTSATVPWTPAPWPTVGKAGPEQRTPDLAAILQELIDRDGWSRGNAVALLVTGTGRRTAESYDGDHDAAPLLHVEYAEAAAPTTTVTVTTTSTTVTETSTTVTTTTVSSTEPATTVTSTTATVTSTSSTLPPSTAMVVITVAASTDDAEEDGAGDVLVTGAQLVLGAPAAPPVSFEDQVQPILTTRCATVTCHGGPRPQEQLHLGDGEAHRALIGMPSTECPGTSRVAPGDPDASYIVAKVQGAGPCFSGIRMPPGSGLSPEEIAVIRNWIAQGAPDD